MTDVRTAMKKQTSYNVALSLRFSREPEGGVHRDLQRTSGTDNIRQNVR